MGRKAPAGARPPRARPATKFLSRGIHLHTWPCSLCTATFDHKAEVEEHEGLRHP